MDAKFAFTLLLIALMILPAVAVAGYRFRRALREREGERRDSHLADKDPTDESL